MRKSTRIVKKLLALFLVVLMSINTLGAVVSDNDGSAFITKAEFDSLKNDFQSQIDQYNTSIDSKIDGAIASYLAGINVAKKTTFTLDRNAGYTFPLYMDGGDKLWNDPTSNYYDISVPKAVIKRAELWDDSRYMGYTKWKYNQDNNMNVSIGTLVGAGYTVARIGVREYAYEYPGRFGTTFEVERTALKRKVDGTTENFIWKINNFGTCQNEVYYIGDVAQGEALNDGGPDRSNNMVFHYLSAYGFPDAGNASPLTISHLTSSKSQWTPTQFTGGGAGNNNNSVAKLYTGVSNYSHIKNQWSCAWKNESRDLGSPLTVVPNWESTGLRHWCYAGNTSIQANRKGIWRLNPYTGTSLENTPVTIYTQPMGYKHLVAFRFTGTRTTAPNFNAWGYFAWPNFQSATNNDLNTGSNAVFSQLPASVVYWEDNDGDMHFMDEGFYLTKMTGEGECEFSVKFGTDSGTKNLNFIASTKPFDRSITAADYIKVKIGNEERISWELQTGQKYGIKIENLEKNDKVYLYWKPRTQGQYIFLNEITDMYQTIS